MKIIRRLAVAVVLIALLLYGYFALSNISSDGGALAADIPSEVTQESAGKNPEKVTIFDPSGTDSSSKLELLGTVKANDQIKLYATTAGQLQQILVKDGSIVKKGEPLFYIGGINGTKPASLVQLEMAQSNYDTALDGLEIARLGNEAALKSAELQLNSAIHLTEGSNLDVQVMDQNLIGSKAGINILRDSLTALSAVNGAKTEDAEEAIESLKDNILNLEEDIYELREEMDERLDNAESADERSQIIAEMEAQITASEAALEGLYAQLEEAQDGYEALRDSNAIAENQLLAQIRASEIQGKNLYLTQLSTESKLGLSEQSSDSQRLAEEAVEAVKVKNAATLLQAEAQVNLAKSNLELAAIQASGLVVIAPIDGTVGNITARVGDLVGTQSPLAQVYGQSDYILEVGVDATNADLITEISKAEVLIGGKYIPVSIKNISLSLDSMTRLATVTLTLPKVNFRANQTLRARIFIDNGSSPAEGSSSLNIPLDAVIIGTGEQYVYVIEEGKAIKKPVRTGDINGDMVQILEGLTVSDKVIVDGAKSLTEGQEVTF